MIRKCPAVVHPERVRRLQPRLVHTDNQRPIISHHLRV